MIELNIIEMAIKGLDYNDLVKKYNLICGKGADGQTMLEFLQYVIPRYENAKRELLSQAIEQCFIALSDSMMTDPLDQNVYSHMSQLKHIANYLNITIDGGTNK